MGKCGPQHSRGAAEGVKSLQEQVQLRSAEKGAREQLHSTHFRNDVGISVLIASSSPHW